MAEPAAPAAPAAAPVAAPAAKPAPAPKATPAAAAAPAAKVTAANFRHMRREAPEPEAAPEPSPELEAEPDPLEPDPPEAVEGEEPEGAPEEEVDPDAPEAPEPDPNALPEEVHGIPTKDLIEALLSGTIPEALWDKLQIECVDGDERWTGDLNKLRNGAQMHAAYTRKSMALAEDKKKHAGEIQAFNAEREELYEMVRSWKDPVKLKRAARSLGLPLQEVAIMWAEEYDKRSKLPPEVVAELDAHEAREIELEKRARELRAKERKLQELETGRTQNENSAKGDAYTKFVMSHLPDAFKAVGIQTTANTEKIILGRFQEALGVFWPEDQPPTKEMVYAAAQATAELLGVQKAPAPAAKTSPAAAQVAALKAAKTAPAQPARKPQPLAGGVSYDPGKARSPARKTISARGMAEALRKARTGR